MTDAPGETVVTALNALAGGLFLLTAFGLVATRQTQAAIRLFIAGALLLAASAFLIGIHIGSVELLAVGCINLITKPVVIPWTLRRLLPEAVYTRREIAQTVNIPTSLLIALALVLFAYSIAGHLLAVVPATVFASINLPVGFAGLLLGAYTVAVRREAVPQLMGILAIENAAFFAAIAIVPDLPLIAEVAAALDVIVLVLVVSVLTRAIHERVGTTEVAALIRLREAPRP